MLTGVVEEVRILRSDCKMRLIFPVRTSCTLLYWAPHCDKGVQECSGADSAAEVQSCQPLWMIMLLPCSYVTLLTYTAAVYQLGANSSNNFLTGTVS